MKKISYSLFVFSFSLVYSISVHASLIELDLLAPGDKLITLDTETGLEWLDLSTTLNEPYNSVAAGYGGFTNTYGFSYATESDVIALFQNVGLSDGWSLANYPGAYELKNKLGYSAGPMLGVFFAGIADYDVFSSIKAAAFVIGYDLECPGPHCMGGYAAFHPDEIDKNWQGNMLYSIVGAGSWLIRSHPVPEPTTIFLLVSSLLGLGAFRKKLRQK